jgi:hypothetical protein
MFSVSAEKLPVHIEYLSFTYRSLQHARARPNRWLRYAQLEATHKGINCEQIA